MKNAMRKISTLALAFVMIFCFAQGTVSANAKDTEAWQSNVIVEDPFDVLGIDREKIATVTFLDSTDEAPLKPWYMGKGYSRRVLGWVEWNGGLADVCFAAEGGINGESCTDALFADMPALTEVAFNGAFHTEEATSMAKMFRNCESLEAVDAETLNTANVTTMYEMFRGCTSLKSIDVSGWDTSRVKNMYCMFSTCTRLEELDLSHFDTSRVTKMGFLFSACRSLETVDVSGWNTRKVTNMEGMFRWCDVLEEPDFSSWDVSRVRNSDNFMNPGMRINGQVWERFFQ